MLRGALGAQADPLGDLEEFCGILRAEPPIPLTFIPVCSLRVRTQACPEASGLGHHVRYAMAYSSEAAQLRGC
jgi:hypothetical protein